jgi:hypothetical protein
MSHNQGLTDHRSGSHHQTMFFPKWCKMCQKRLQSPCLVNRKTSLQQSELSVFIFTPNSGCNFRLAWLRSDCHAEWALFYLLLCFSCGTYLLLREREREACLYDVVPERDVCWSEHVPTLLLLRMWYGNWRERSECLFNTVTPQSGSIPLKKSV